MKKSKKIIPLLIIFMLLISYVAPVMAYSTNTFTVKRSATRDGYQYWLNGKRVNKYSVSGYDSAYCLKAEANFTNASYSYNRSYNMKTEVDEIKDVDWGNNKLTHAKKTVSIKRTYEKSDSGSYAYTRPVLTVNENGTGVTYCNYNAVLWILDNMYVPVSSASKNKDFKKQLYESVFADAIEKVDFNVNSVKLTDEDIEVVQQWAIWYFTNSGNSNYHVTELPTVQMKDSSGTLHTINSLNIAGRKQRYMNALYVYLIENAMKNADQYGYGSTRKVKANYTTKGYICSIAGSYGSQQPILKVTRDIPTDNKYKVIVRKYDSQTGALISSDMKVQVEQAISTPGTSGEVWIGNSTSSSTVKGTGTVATCDITDITANDTITILETAAPSGYNSLNGVITLDIGKKILDGTYSVSSAKVKCAYSEDEGRVRVHVNSVNSLINTGEEVNAIYVDIYDDKIEAGFDVNIRKIDKNTGNLIDSEAVFEFVETPAEVSGNKTAYTVNGVAQFGYQTIRSETKAGTYKYYIREVQSPVGYVGLDENTMIELAITVGLKNDNTGYMVLDTSVNLVDNQKNVISNNPDMISAEINGDNQIILTVPNEQVSGKYEMSFVKVDEDNTSLKLDGAVFDVSYVCYEGNSTEIGSDTRLDVQKIEQEITCEGIDVYTITERQSPTGYVGLESPFTITVTKKLVDNGYIVDNIGYSSSDKVLVEVERDNNCSITIKIKNKKLEGSYQLEVEKQDENGNDINGGSFMVYYPGGTGVESFTINDKNPNPYSLIKQEIREEGTDEWIISELEAPEGYVRLEKEIHVTVKKYLDTANNKWDISDIEIKDLDGNDVSDIVSLERDDDNNLFKIKIINKKIEGNYSLYFTKEDALTGSRIYSSDTTFKVTRNNEDSEEVNLGAGMKIIGPFEIESNMQVDTYTIEEVKAPEGYIKLKDSITFKVHSYEMAGKYVPYWVESDSEYIHTYIGNSGTVFITIDNDKIMNSYQLDILKIDAETKTQLNGARFEIKYPGETEYQEIIFEEGDFLTAPITMTEEGTDTIYIKEIEAPEGYEKLIDELKIEVTKKIENEKFVITDYKVMNTDGSKAPQGTEISLQNESTIGVKVPNEMKTGVYNLELVKYDDENTKLQGAEFEVTMPDGTTKQVITDSQGKANIGDMEITSEGTDEYTIKETKAPEGYQLLTSEFKIKVQKVKANSGYTMGDIELITNDQDIECTTSGAQIQIGITNRELTDYDLSLRKFITSVNDKAPEVSREPIVDTSKLKDASSTTATYTHTKEPLLVANTDTVVYTLRMYNEGISSAYVAELEDDIPLGLEFISDNEINTKYGWKMYDGQGNETTDVTEAKTIKTDYLSKEKSEERQEDNLLKAFDYKEGTELDYRDVQVAFKVVGEETLSDRLIINTAEITKETDENGEQVKDRDSTPDNGKENEDDIDKEYLKLKYFDLSLLKWVSSTMVTENGKTTETLTGHTGLENPEPVVKVELNRKKLDELTVKFAYIIKVTNEGQLEGYAKEISDYIPEGLKFVAEDNPEWSEKDGKIVTRQLENTLLQPGESAEVTVILTWINGEDNLGLKINVAEISEDFNSYSEKDIDSTPDNLQEGEDDIDNASVLLSISTGRAKVYIVLITVIMIVIASGIILIKKFVM